MSDAPGQAMKTKKDASMRVCFELCRRGEAAAVVSAGNSGAMMAGSLLILRRLPGVERPAIVALAPTREGSHCVVLDVGANLEVKPSTLAQFAVLGATYARQILDRPRPRVAVLANGEEASKGTELTREAYRLLRVAAADPRAEFVFAGYAEGRDFFSGQQDVIVTDGFTGNLCLKTFEGATHLIFDLLRAEVDRLARAKIGAALMRPAFRALRRRLEPDEHGGLPLLGVDGVVIIGHGRSTAKAIKNAIFTADRYREAGLARAVAESVARHLPLFPAADQEPVGGPAT